MDVDDTDNLSLFLDVEGMTSLGVGFSGVAYTYPCLLLASMLAIQSRPTSKTNRRKNIFKIDGSHCLYRRAQQRELVTQVGALMWLKDGLDGPIGFDGVTYLACPFQVESWAWRPRPRFGPP